MSRALAKLQREAAADVLARLPVLEQRAAEKQAEAERLGEPSLAAPWLELRDLFRELRPLAKAQLARGR